MSRASPGRPLTAALSLSTVVTLLGLLDFSERLQFGLNRVVGAVLMGP